MANEERVTNVQKTRHYMIAALGRLRSSITRHCPIVCSAGRSFDRAVVRSLARPSLVRSLDAARR